MFKIHGPSNSILFTGDLGNTPHPLLNDTELPGKTGFIVMESVYGDRNHEDIEHRSDRFAAVIQKAVKENRTLLIPVFSLERSQDILFELNRLVEGKEIPDVPVFLDSPLAIKVTDIYRTYEKDSHFFNKDIQAAAKKGDDVFAFPGLTETLTNQESKDIERVKGAKIIIAGSGMSHGGRILSHEIEYLSNPKTMILFVGYQVPGTLGRRILDGAKSVRIMTKTVNVRAEIHSIFSYSAHKDSDHLLEFASSATGLDKLFIVLGEPKSRMFLSQRFREYYNIQATLPERTQGFEIEL